MRTSFKKQTSPHSLSLRVRPRGKPSCLVGRMGLSGPLAIVTGLGLGEVGDFYANLIGEPV